MTEIHSETKQPRVLGQTASPADERPMITDLARRVRNLHLIRRLRIADLIVIGVVVVAIVAGLLFLARQTALNRESTNAKAVTDQVVAKLAKQDTTAIRSMGTKDFQTEFDKADLTKQLRQFGVLYGNVKPALDGRVISNNSKRQYVGITYRYDLLKVPFYIRVDVIKQAGSKQWQVQAIATGVPPAPDDGSNQTTPTQSI